MGDEGVWRTIPYTEKKYPIKSNFFFIRRKVRVFCYFYYFNEECRKSKEGNGFSMIESLETDQKG